MKGKIQWGILCFVLFISGAFYLQSNHEWALTQRAMTEVSEGVQQGEKASPLTLNNLSGEQVNLSDFKGENVFLIFFTTWCHICGEQWGQLELAKKGGLLDDVQVIAVNLTKGERNVDNVIAYTESITLDDVVFLLDEEGAAQDLYHVYGVPISLIIDKEGIIETRVDGFFTVEKMLESQIINK
ncbi:peroxiredoxin [Evansella vedderi]|uniref:Peroxiredoxin n=1 Tax=Evansella vedderi TaxID=38282 RepID=A0ABT9ZVZ4_9BACI|nr:TlpA disulfide reductase family protein [Evansella vedderi]MDQ0255406.1 peroxiredoxin [Evansella vedderi]